MCLSCQRVNKQFYYFCDRETGMDKQIQPSVPNYPAERGIDYDIAIIYDKEDFQDVLEFKEHLVTDVLESKDKQNISVVSFDTTMMKNIREALTKSRFAFLFLTRSFCEESWPRLSQESVVRNVLYGDESGCIIVPIFTVNRSESTFKIPLGLNVLKGLRYCDRDQFYTASVIKLLF